MSMRSMFLKFVAKTNLQFLKNKVVLVVVLLTILSLILIWILWFWKMIQFGQIYSPLFSNQLFGNFASYSLPVFSTLVFFINFYLAQKSYFKERIAAFFLLGSGFFIQVLTLILIRFYLAQGF